MKSHPLVFIYSILLVLGLGSAEAFASAAEKCRTDAEGEKRMCKSKVDDVRTANRQMAEATAARARARGDAIAPAGSELETALSTANRNLADGMKQCKERKDKCKDVCKESNGKDAAEKKKIADYKKKCEKDIQTLLSQMEQDHAQNNTAAPQAKETNKQAGASPGGGDKGGGDKGGGEQGKGQQQGGGQPPGGQPPQGEPPKNQAQTPTPTPTALPGQVSGGTPVASVPQECNEASFQTNPNCVPKGTAGSTAVATVEDPLKKKCEGTTDQSAECLAYRGQKAGVNIPAGGIGTASAGGGGGGGGLGSSGAQATLVPDIKIPETAAGMKEGLGGGVDSAGGFSGYGTASAGGAGLEDLPPLGGGGRATASASAGSFGTMSANATDIGRTPGPSVISIVSDVIRNRCNAGRFLHCEPKR